MILPRGITGFYKELKDKPPTVDETVWKRDCYKVARQFGGTVINYEPSTVSLASYHTTVIQLPTATIAVLCNAYYPVLAFTDEITFRFGRIHYIAVPLLANIYQVETTFIPIDISFLCAFPEQEMLTSLNEVELRQVQKWQPQQAGDIIFHHWD